jgi:hypothetical protein
MYAGPIMFEQFVLCNAWIYIQFHGGMTADEWDTQYALCLQAWTVTCDVEPPTPRAGCVNTVFAFEADANPGFEFPDVQVLDAPATPRLAGSA